MRFYLKLSWVVACLSAGDRKSTRLNFSHVRISYAVFCLKKKNLTEPVALSVGRPGASGPVHPPFTLGQRRRHRPNRGCPPGSHARLVKAAPPSSTLRRSR